MIRIFGGMDMSHTFPKKETLVLNTNNCLIKSVLELKDTEDRKEDVKLICEQVYELAMMIHIQLDEEAMRMFIERSSQILGKLRGHIISRRKGSQTPPNPSFIKTF